MTSGIHENPAPLGGNIQGRSRRLRAALVTHRWFVMLGLLSCGLFVAIVTQGTGRLMEAEAFGDFYDFQAKSLLEGRLDVPLEAIQFEAFVREGKVYGYFGLTPALLRLPWAGLDVGFGHWSRLYMVGYFAAALIAGYLLLIEAVRRVSGRDVPSATETVLWTLNAGVGSTLFFLSSRAYIYHEAILCGAALALWSVWAALRYLDDPRTRWWGWSLACGVLAVHARPSIGLFALTVLGLCAAAIVWRQWRIRKSGVLSRSWWRQGVLVAGLAVAGIASFNGVSYLKFRTIEGCPLRLNVQYDAERLARIDGRQFHLSNLRFATFAYLLRPDATLSPYFPYIRLSEADKTKFPEAKIDLMDPMLGFPFAMPALVLASIVGLIVAVRVGGVAREPVGILWLAVLPMGASMFAAIAVSHRYTADFCPFFLVTAAFGIASLGQVASVGRRVLVVLLWAGTLVALPLSLAVTLHNQGEKAWLVPPAVRAQYASLRWKVDSLFGVKNPSGYDAAALPIRNVDARFLLWTADHLLNDPTKHAVVIEIARQLVRLMPDNGVVQARAAAFLIAGDQTKEGTAAYEHALQLDPTLAVAHSNLGVVYYETGRFEEAAREFETALKLDPTIPQAREALQILQRGKRP